MIRLLLIILLLLPTRAFGMEMIGFGTSACATQSISVSQTTTNNDYEIWLSGSAQQTRGQSFTVPSNITLYSIIINGNNPEGGSGNATLRIGEYTDLTSSYTQVGPVAYSGVTVVEYEFVFSEPRPTLYTSTTYYFGISTNATVVDNALYINKWDGDVYANGSVWNAGSSLWNLESEATTRDIRFKVMKCD